MVDYSRFRRSENVEGAPSDPIKSFFGLLTAPLQASFHDLTTHPFERPDEYYGRMFRETNPVPTPDQYTPLGKEAGIEHVVGPRDYPPLEDPFWTSHKVTMDPEHIQVLLDAITPPEPFNDRWAQSDLPLLRKKPIGLPEPSGSLGDY